MPAHAPYHYAEPLSYETFTLKIKLGNDAMQSRADIMESLEIIGENVAMSDATAGTIRDPYGNTVGSWELS